MTSESKLAGAIFAVLIVAIAVPWLMWQRHEAARPELLEVRVVTATDADPVFRDGLRRLSPDDQLSVAVAIKVGVPGEPPMWLAPAPELELGGDPVEHIEASEWPEPDRIVRVFWFTVESSFVGGELDPATATKRLRYKSFLAPEMGQALVAAAEPVAHNVDHLGRVEGRLPMAGGTLRIYARVQVAERVGKVASTQAVSSPGLEALMSETLTTVSRSSPLPEPLVAEAGELFMLPGWEGIDDHTEAAIEEVFGIGSDQLIEHRLATTSLGFALEVIGADSGEELERIAVLELADGHLLRSGSRQRWNDDVAIGDIVLADDRWLVLLGDDGDGVLDIEDSVIWCSKRPAMASNLEIALGEAVDGLGLHRLSSR